MRAAVQTRGRMRHVDYAFLGPPPEPAWWRTYDTHTSFEQPTILLHSDGRRWDAYLSGIPSRRRDAVGTTIRFTLVLDGDPADAAPALALVAAWLTDLGDRGPSAAVGTVVSEALDTAFPETEVERLLANPGEPGGVDAQDRVLGLLPTLQAAPAVPAVERQRDWLWALDVPQAREVFLLRAGELLAGTPGRALLLNLVGGPDDVAPLLDDPRPLAVLGTELGPDAGTALVPLRRAGTPPGNGTPPGKERAPSRAGAARRIRTQLRTAIVLATILAATLAAALSALVWTR